MNKQSIEYLDHHDDSMSAFSPDASWPKEIIGLNSTSTHVLDADTLHRMLPNDNLILIDVRCQKQHSEGYIPNAIVLDTRILYRSAGKVEGLMPDSASLVSILSSVGIQPKHHVVVYDDETGVDATRLLWLLEAIGHNQYSLLSGGFEAWKQSEFTLSDKPREAIPSLYPVRKYIDEVNVSKEQILQAITDHSFLIVDTRSISEYNGMDVRAERGGRIPGAIHLGWDELIDYYDTGEILPATEIESLLLEKGITFDKRIIVYCQSNRRSAHTFIILKSLGYDVSTYDGSWSEWGNDNDLPIEI